MEPSSGDVGPTPDIRSKVTDRFGLAIISGPGTDGGRSFLSTEESVGVEAVELGLRFKAERGSVGGTKAVTDAVPLVVAATPGGLLLEDRGGFVGGAETTGGSLERAGTSNSSKV
jgi:hypothetical protein